MRETRFVRVFFRLRYRSIPVADMERMANDSRANAEEFERFIHADTLPTPEPAAQALLPPELERRIAAIEGAISTLKRNVAGLSNTARRQEILCQSMELNIASFPALVDSLRAAIATDIAMKNLARDGIAP